MKIKINKIKINAGRREAKAFNVQQLAKKLYSQEDKIVVK